MDAYNQVLQHYGKESQLKKVMEELDELKKEVYSALYIYANRENIVSEMADVINMLIQLQIIYNIDDKELTAEMSRKMQRTLEQIV